MRRSEVVQQIDAIMSRSGIPRHLYCARSMPAYVEFSIVIGGQFHKLQLRSGIPQWEFEKNLADVETQIILNRNGQKDIETWRPAPIASGKDSSIESETT